LLLMLCSFLSASIVSASSEFLFPLLLLISLVLAEDALEMSVILESVHD
jgi:hypothetical protein